MSTNNKIKNKNKKDPKIEIEFSIDCTPKWADIILIHARVAIESEDSHARETATSEILRCAQAADAGNKLVKLMKQKPELFAKLLKESNKNTL